MRWRGVHVALRTGIMVIDDMVRVDSFARNAIVRY
jgi:hypothetical protein